MLEPVIPCNFTVGSSYFEARSNGSYILFTVRGIVFDSPVGCKVQTTDYYESAYPGGKPVTQVSDSSSFDTCYLLPSALSPEEVKLQFPELLL